MNDAAKKIEMLLEADYENLMRNTGNPTTQGTRDRVAGAIWRLRKDSKKGFGNLPVPKATQEVIRNLKGNLLKNINAGNQIKGGK
jgi:hypothetical protein